MRATVDLSPKLREQDSADGPRFLMPWGYCALTDLLDLDHHSGVLFWKNRPENWFASENAFLSWNSRYSGQAVGRINSGGYRVFSLAHKLVKAHRFVFAIANGAWPEGHIDHVNGNPSDNRPQNLRDVSRQENQKNLRMPSHNTSGFVGVLWCRKSRKWRAQVFRDGRSQSLGFYAEKDDAVAARAAANLRMGFHPNHGKRRAENAS